MSGQRDIRDLRVHYDMGTLSEADLAAAPLPQFRTWFDEAVAAGLAEPNAMVVATVSAEGVPSARTVLLKDVDARGFAFYTNLSSRKGREIAETRRVSLVFPWYDLHRQVVVIGEVIEVPRDEAASYFASRPRESQLGAWTSHQSQVIADRAVLDARYADMTQRFPDAVPLPDFWGGWIVVADTVEFWQGRESRLHDRLRYRRTRANVGLDDAAGWIVERLSP